MELNFLILEDILKDPEFASSLAYLVDFKEHKNLEVVSKKYSIELSNSTITIIFIKYVGFENDEYEELKNRPNLNIVSLDSVTHKMIEFKHMPFKVIDKFAWFFSTLSRSKLNSIKRLDRLARLKID